VACSRSPCEHPARSGARLQALEQRCASKTEYRSSPKARVGSGMAPKRQSDRDCRVGDKPQKYESDTRSRCDRSEEEYASRPPQARVSSCDCGGRAVAARLLLVSDRPRRTIAPKAGVWWVGGDRLLALLCSAVIIRMPRDTNPCVERPG
jgi:hypothetical protein